MLTKNQIKAIEDFVSYPRGLGYVSDFSDKEFADWFLINWHTRIEADQFRDRGDSKRHRLMSFCIQSEPKVILAVLSALKAHVMRANEGLEPLPLPVAREFEDVLSQLLLETKETVDNPATTYSARKIRKQLSSNSTSILLTTASLTEQVISFAEKVRSANFLGAHDPDLRDEVLDFLELFIKELEALLQLLPKDSLNPSETQVEETASWAKRYVNSAVPAWQKLLDPNRLGEATAPASIILGCGTLGALLTGLNPIGFGTGSLVGKWITGELKSSAAADRLEEQFESDGHK